MHITGIKIPEANSLKISFKGKRYTFSKKTGKLRKKK